MIRLTSKLNFTKTTSFNLVLFVNVDSVRMVKERMMGEGAVYTQTAHFYVKNSHQSRDRTGMYKIFLACSIISIFSFTYVKPFLLLKLENYTEKIITLLIGFYCTVSIIDPGLLRFCLKFRRLKWRMVLQMFKA